MKAFHNDVNIQKKYLDRIYAHAKADNFIKGKYWENGKGCAVGCTIESDNHKAYETELGVPEWLARLEDTIFENLPNDLAKKWPVQFLEAINLGSDLENIKKPFIIYLMNENLKSIRSCVYNVEKNPEVKKAIDLVEAAILQMIEAQESCDADKISAAESAARSAARSAVWSAESAAESAARSAESTRSAAESAVWSAESAARSAESTRSAAFQNHANKILELIRACK
jgi:hypothetical protein